MLPKFYQTHLKSQLSLAEYLLLKILLTQKLSVKEYRSMLVVLKNMGVLKGGIAVFISAYMVKLGSISWNLA
jgi:hypothetical protein